MGVFTLDAEVNDQSYDIAAAYESYYKVKLEMFEGPLDLLLHLIKKNELDIYDIPISIITRQYLEYVKLLKELNLEIAGEFLVMASTLLQIKSQMLLPASVDEESDDMEDDPRAELIRRLVEYQKFKDAAIQLDGRELVGRELFTCKLAEPETEDCQEQEEILEVELFELIAAFQDVLKRLPVESFHEVSTESISIAERINEILSLLQGNNAVHFDELFAQGYSREYLIANFLAILELCKLKMVRIVQTGLFAEIWITPAVADVDFTTVTEDAIDYV
jgi:segregation and condensation protein A